MKKTREHLFSCPTLDEQNNGAWETAMEKFKNDIDKEMIEFKKKKRERGTFSRNKSKTQDVNKVLKFLSDFEDNTFESIKKLLDFTLGLIQESDIKKLGRVIGSIRGIVTKARALLAKFNHKLRKYFREFTWKARCKVIIEMERTRGIERKDKKKSRKKKKRMENHKDKA